MEGHTMFLVCPAYLDNDGARQSCGAASATVECQSGRVTVLGCL